MAFTETFLNLQQKGEEGSLTSSNRVASACSVWWLAPDTQRQGFANTVQSEPLGLLLPSSCHRCRDPEKTVAWGPIPDAGVAV